MGKRAAAVVVPVCLGAVLPGIVVAALMGKLYPYEVPQEYRTTCQALADAAYP
jgi:hypothetical protein